MAALFIIAKQTKKNKQTKKQPKWSTVEDKASACPTEAASPTACPTEAASPPGETGSIGIQVDLARAAAQQRTSRLHLNTHLSILQVAGLVPLFYGQRKNPRKNFNGKMSRRLLFYMKNLYTQKRVKESKKGNTSLPPPSCPSNSFFSSGWQNKPQITRHNSWCGFTR